MIQLMSRRAVARAAVLLGVAASLPVAVSAADVAGQAQGTQSVASAGWGVVPTTSASSPPPGALTLTYAAILSPPAQYFDAVNTGTITLSGASYGVAVSGGGLGSPTITLNACANGTWNTVTGLCSGTTVVLGSWTAASAAAVASGTVPAAPASRLGIQAVISAGGSLTALTTAVINISVSSSSPQQIRPPTTTSA